MESYNPAETDLMERVALRLAEGGRARPGSRLEYLEAMLGSALAAFQRGDYAIAAVAAVRREEREVIAVRANTVFSQCNPRGHAEANALAALVPSPGRGDTIWPWRDREYWWYRPENYQGKREVGLFERSGADYEDFGDSILYTTLEPCPMCTVILLTAGVKKVVIAKEDVLSGAIGPNGIRQMPPVFGQIAAEQKLVIEYLPESGPEAELSNLMGELFAGSRARLDRKLGSGGLLGGAYQ